jgi:hypothetical protein
MYHIFQNYIPLTAALSEKDKERMCLLYFKILSEIFLIIKKQLNIIIKVLSFSSKASFIVVNVKETAIFYRFSKNPQI